MLLALSLAALSFVASLPIVVSLHETFHAVAVALVLCSAAASGRIAINTAAAGLRAAGAACFDSIRHCLSQAHLLPGYILLGMPLPRGSSAPCLELHLVSDGSCTDTCSADGFKHSAFIRHAGWAGSLAITLLVASAGDALSGSVHGGLWAGMLASCACVALGSMSTDLLGSTLTATAPVVTVPGRREALATFYCGNIGLLVANIGKSAVNIMDVLRAQVAVSSQRGAQSGGTCLPRIML